MQERASHPLIAIVGPTAAGKSSLALQLAQSFDGEIVNGDSRLVYRHMDIGSAKPSPQDLSLAPHHLVNIVNPDDPYSLALYLAQANEAIQRHTKPGQNVPAGRRLRAVRPRIAGGLQRPAGIAKPSAEGYAGGPGSGGKALKPCGNACGR